MNSAFFDFTTHQLRPLARPELRKDPIVGRWVIIATDRARRSLTSHADALPSETQACPFCAGREEETPHEILAYRDPHAGTNNRGWKVRVVPNKFPALQIEGRLEEHIDGIYDGMNGIGAHEVIIECPHHEVSMARLSEANIGDVLRAYRDRLSDLKQDERLVYGMVFKNVGSAAGASLEHSHSQLIVMPIVPINVWEEMTSAQEFHSRNGRCIFCDMLLQERDTGQRIVLESPHFLALAPFASRFPFETWILPKVHGSHFEEIQPSETEDLARMLKDILTRLEVGLDRPAYNYMIHTSPFRVHSLRHYHWHIEIIPRLTRVAGFEWGTGFYINPVPPEQAAAYLRQVKSVLPERPGECV